MPRSHALLLLLALLAAAATLRLVVVRRADLREREDRATGQRDAR